MLHPYMRCPVRKGARTQLVFSSAYLSRPRKGRALEGTTADAMMFWVSRCGAADGERPWSDEATPVSARLYQALLREDAAFEDLSAEMSMGQREIRQSLMAEGTSFRGLRRAALLQRVRPHMLADASTDDIALALGYSDARSLRRAIKLAGGISLSDLRMAPPTDWVGNETVISNLRRQMCYME
jgi:AraC-like DNA-binding protein